MAGSAHTAAVALVRPDRGLVRTIRIHPRKSVTFERSAVLFTSLPRQELARFEVMPGLPLQHSQ